MLQHPGRDLGVIAMRWQEKYKEKLRLADDAVAVVKNGDRVWMTSIAAPVALGTALAARSRELEDVSVFENAPMVSFPWYAPDADPGVTVKPGFVTHVGRHGIQQRYTDLRVQIPSTWHTYPERALEGKFADVGMVLVSPPDEHGYCSFGHMIWEGRLIADHSRIVLAEVDPRFIRTFGDNALHVSQIDYLIENPELPPLPTLPGYAASDDVTLLQIAEHVQELVRDGDTIQTGVGDISLTLAPFLGEKHDLGIHSELVSSELVELVEAGVINGSRKSINRGKVVTTCFLVREDLLSHVHMNPAFELHPGEYVNDIRIISAHDNLVAINNALSVDLTGQVTAETLGATPYSSPGGQLDFVIGAAASRGGRSITVLPATALAGKVSRIVPQFAAGTVVTVPRTLADYIVTEYGIATLRDKTQRERAEELVAVAHPDFRAQLRDEARKLFWP